MGFIENFFKIKERRMWQEVMSQLPPDDLVDMTKRDFLRPSTPEMKDRVELLKQRVSGMNNRASQSNNQYRDELQRTLDEAAKGREDYDKHNSGMHDLGNHSAHSSSIAWALAMAQELQTETTRSEPAPYRFDPNNQQAYKRDTTYEQNPSGRSR